MGSAEIAYTVIRSRRRRRTFGIRVDARRGVLVAVPWRTSTTEVAELVRRRADWIERQIREMALRPPPRQLVTGDPLPYLGTQIALRVEATEARKVILVDVDGAELTVVVPGNLDVDERRPAVAAALERWYSERAAADVAQRVSVWSPVVGELPTAVLVRNQKRLWGSCGPDGTLRFNWRLVQLTPDLIDYVVVHELSHLLVRNHSARFWAQVGRVLPDYPERRQRLRQAGQLVVL